MYQNAWVVFSHVNESHPSLNSMNDVKNKFINLSKERKVVLDTSILICFVWMICIVPVPLLVNVIWRKDIVEDDITDISERTTMS